jgi:UDP-N-acetylmuramoyl-tripeptide--D-alanyl-D-alanine ligase
MQSVLTLNAPLTHPCRATLMKGYTPEQLAGWSGGVWSARPATPITGVSIDSRTLAPGDLFVAVRGEHHDGRQFLGAAFAAGAAAAMVDGHGEPAGPAPGPLLRVPDTRLGLMDLARGRRSEWTGTVIGVTGSVGKTTVKEMLAAILARRGQVGCTRGNWNNDLGLPLSLLNAPSGARYGVFEVGMNHPGELASLCRALQPQWGVMTRIGPVHLAQFESVEAIAMEKAELFRSLPADGVAVLSRDDPWSALLGRAAPGRMVTVSLRDPAADYQGHIVSLHPLVVEIRGRQLSRPEQLELPLPGEFTAGNALLAAAAACELDTPWSDIQSALASFLPAVMRWQVVELDGMTWINDSYNANPVSMQAVLKTVNDEPCAGRKWLVLGGMWELGQAEAEAHLTVGAECAGVAGGRLVTVGRLGGLMAEGARRAGLPEIAITTCSSHAEAVSVLKAQAAPGDLILLKGSRGERLETILRLWKEDRGRGPAPPAGRPERE